MTARIYQGHDPAHGPGGTDVLVDLDALTFALRPGKDDTYASWGPPVPLADASVLRLVRGDLDGGRRS